MTPERGWFVGERNALALLILVAHAVLFWLLWSAMQDLQWAALAAIYAFAFIAVGASWFFGRWFAIGVGWFGVAVVIWLTGGQYDPLLTSAGGAHLALVLLLSGKAMGADHEGRSRFLGRLRDSAVSRIRLFVMLLGVALPGLVVLGSMLGYGSARGGVASLSVQRLADALLR